MGPWEVAAAVGAEVGEGPAWDEREGVLWFVDVMEGTLFRYDPVAGRLDRRSLGLPLGAAIPARDGGLILAMADGVHRYSWGAQETIRIVPVEADNPEVRMNDAKCDPCGRLWAGTMAYDFTPGASCLYRFDPSGPTAVVPDCTIANGTGWSPDGTLMYFIDTPTGRIDVLDYDLATGAASNRRPWVTIEENAGMPDGMTVDADGCIWVALWGGGAVRRYGPDGTLSDVVTLPVTQVASVCFGGATMTDLFVTTAAFQLSEADLGDQPLAGATFVMATDVTGARTVPVDASTLTPAP